MKLTAPAFAKINLGLRVYGLRTDGYHEIETVFHRINLWDEVSLTPADDITVSSSSPDVPQGEENICYRAAHVLRDHLRIKSGVHITVTKRIPVGSGLGGGSSDAATVLRELPKLWTKEITTKDLMVLAGSIGSDVPFFIRPGTAVGTGRGTMLEYFELSVPFAILVCSPGIHVSTSWAYRQLRLKRNQTEPSLRREIENALSQDPPDCSALANDFEETVFQRFPEIGELKKSLSTSGALCASLSGSGSSVFAFFRDTASAYEIGAALAKPGYTVSVTPPCFTPTNNAPGLS